jgi:argininosuccinate synthase
MNDDEERRMWDATTAPDRAPASPPYVVTISWSVGDSLYVDCGELEGWEVLMLLEQAAETIRDAEQAEQAAAEGEDAEP